MRCILKLIPEMSKVIPDRELLQWTRGVICLQSKRGFDIHKMKFHVINNWAHAVCW